MALTTGTRLGPYEITGALGAGGMGEVYRARDTRLERTVAIKILPAQLSSDLALRQRFEREAKAISSLQHPRICVLHDIGRQDGVDYLVMEYLEGETLAARLARGTLPLAEALRIGSEIAEALDKAHAHGIVHRDLKPGNVMLTKGGAKLMDFGLAKAVRPAVGTGALSQEATRTHPSDPITAAGTVLGTFQYLAPEVVEGAEADARADIFALGCVLYEMVTGRRAFEGKSATSVFAAILERDPEPIARLIPVVPPALDRIVRACLEKQPHLRWQSAHDLMLELRWLAESREAPVEAPRVLRWIPWVVAAVLALLLAAFLARSRMERPSAPRQPVRSSLMPPPGTSFEPYGFALSPDGGRLAFVAEGKDGSSSLWVRALSSPTAQQLSGTQDAVFPFWSPDGRSIGFHAQGKLKTVDTMTGEVRAVCSSFALVGGTWNADNTIVFAPGVTGVLARVSAGGGAPEPVTRLARAGSGQAHRWPFFLPDGKHFLYVVDWSAPEDAQGNGLYVGSLDGGEGRLVSADISGDAEYANGYLFYYRDLSLAAQLFDPDRLALSGAPIIIGEQGVERNTAFSKAAYSVSRDGTVIFLSAAESPARLTWFDASGRELEQVAQNGTRDPRFSPDGRLLAVTADEAGNGRHDIRVYDLARHVSTGITSSGDDEFPVWSPDQRSIYYATRHGNAFAIERIAVDGSGQPEVLLQGGKMIPNDITSDGHYMVLMTLGQGGAALETYSLVDKKSIDRFRGAEGRLSHDGRWLAHTAPDGELYARSFPSGQAHIQISNGGGAQPSWSRDDRTLYYIAPDKKLMKVCFDPTGRQSPSPPQVVMQTRIIGARFSYIQYDVTPDGQRFLIDSLPAGGGGPLALITGWTPSAASAASH